MQHNTTQQNITHRHRTHTRARAHKHTNTHTGKTYRGELIIREVQAGEALVNKQRRAEGLRKN